MRIFQRMIVGLAATIGLGMSAPAMAEPILLDSGSIGASHTIAFDGFVDNGPSIAGLSSQLTLTLKSIVNGIYTFDYALTNTGSTSDSISSRVSSFAFNTDPNIVGASSTGTYSFAQVNGSYPNGIGQVDVCFKGADTGSCSGGASAGLFDGESGAGTLALDFGSAIAGLTLDQFFVRYQSVDGIAGVTSASGRQTSTSSGGNEVPEPGMFLLFALALIAILMPKRHKLAFRNQGRSEGMAFA